MNFNKTAECTPKEFDEMNEERRVRLTPSCIGLEVIRSDTLTYGMTPNGFFNTVILNMLKYCDSVDSAVIASRESERKRLKKTGIGEAAEKILLDEYTGQLIRTIEKNLADKKSAEHFQIKLNNKLYEYLINECKEAQFYDDRPGNFFKAVFEEYARKPHIEREKVIFADKIREIEIAIKLQYNLILTVNRHSQTGGTKWEVKPYKILTDVRSSYLYLVCMCRQKTDADRLINEEAAKDWHVASFRIARINSVEYVKTGSVLTDGEKTELDEAVRESGVAYMVKKPVDIKLNISESGYALYLSKLFLRPAIIGKPEPVKGKDKWKQIKLHCTLRQASDYFLSFGEMVEILEPESLREDFAKRYNAACELYVAVPDEE